MYVVFKIKNHIRTYKENLLNIETEAYFPGCRDYFLNGECQLFAFYPIIKIFTIKKYRPWKIAQKKKDKKRGIRNEIRRTIRYFCININFRVNLTSI